MLICVTVFILKHDLFNYFHIGNVNTQNNVDEPGPQLVVEPPPQGLFPLSDVQYKSRLSSKAKRIWFLANAFAPVLRNTQTHFELFWIGLRIRNAFGMNRICTFRVCLFSQILICDLWAFGGFSFIQN